MRGTDPASTSSKIHSLSAHDWQDRYQCASLGCLVYATPTWPLDSFRALTAHGCWEAEVCAPRWNAIVVVAAASQSLPDPAAPPPHPTLLSIPSRAPTQLSCRTFQLPTPTPKKPSCPVFRKCKFNATPNARICAQAIFLSAASSYPDPPAIRSPKRPGCWWR